MFFEHLDDQLKKEAATKVPVRAITAAILEAEEKFESFLSSGDRNQRLAFVSDQIEEICIRTASEAGIDAEIVTPRVMEHLAADMTDEIYQGIAGSEVNAPKAISPSEAIGGGPEATQPGQPAPKGYENRYKNIDVKEKQKEWHGDRQITTSFKQSAYPPPPSPSFEEYVQMVQKNPAAYGIQQPQNINEIRKLYNHMYVKGGGGYDPFEQKQQMQTQYLEPQRMNAMSEKQSASENQDFEYGGKVDDQSRPGSNKGTRYDADSFDPNEQDKDHKGEGYKMVGGEAGGDTNPESHKKDKGNAKEIDPTSGNTDTKVKSPKQNDSHKAPEHPEEKPQFDEINKKSFSLAEAERYHALRQSGVSNEDAEYIVEQGQ